MSRVALCRAFAILSLVFLAIVIAGMPREERAQPRTPRPRDAGVTDEQAEAFAVLDDVFPYEVPPQNPFVEVQFGWPERPDDEGRTAPWASLTRHGFLLADDATSFRVLFLD